MTALTPDSWFSSKTLRARLTAPSGELVDRMVEVRKNPITGRTSRITFSRVNETEAGADHLPAPPPDARWSDRCPFCHPQVLSRTPRLIPDIHPAGRMTRGESLLFPNLYPYGAYSAVSLVDRSHFVEIGTATEISYSDCLVNCADYLKRVHRLDPSAAFMAITQNHLPSAGGSMVHPHLQIHADRIGANHHRFLVDRTTAYGRDAKRGLFGDYTAREIETRDRYVGHTGPWEWMAAFAPEGFFEMWAVFPGRTSLLSLAESEWRHLADGMIRVQKFYRSLNRNGYNFGLLSLETAQSALELRAVMVVRSNFAPWTRSDHTGFEVMLGDMATFTPPEETARLARAFWPA